MFSSVILKALAVLVGHCFVPCQCKSSLGIKSFLILILIVTDIGNVQFMYFYSYFLTDGNVIFIYVLGFFNKIVGRIIEKVFKIKL